MPDELQTQAESSPAPDAQAAPSAEDSNGVQQQDSQQATAPTSQPEQKPWNMPPEQRWEELRREREEWKRAFQEIATRPTQPIIAQPVPQQSDPWNGLVDHPDAQTAQFWQTQRRLMEHERHQAKQEAVRELQPVIDAGMQELARMSTAEFRRQNPEIKPGSEEERMIVAYMNGQIDGIRHNAESAKRNAMFERLESENRSLKGKQSMTATKMAANMTDNSSGIPSTSGLPQKPGDWRDKVREAYRKGGDLSDVANAIGMRRT